MPKHISVPRSVIPACDVDQARYEQILHATADIEKIGAYKIGAALALSIGLGKAVELAKQIAPTKLLIYDHQKAGTDIPDTAQSFARTLKACGVDAFIIFPLAGPMTQRTWTEAAYDHDLLPIIGAQMTHAQFLAKDDGYIRDDAIDQIMSIAIQRHITDYVLPGNQLDVIRKLRTTIEQAGIQPVFYSPGLVIQGGEITAAAHAAGPRWHAIIGRALYEAPDIRQTALELTNVI